MTEHPAMELAVESYVGLLMSLGVIGFGWLLVSQSDSMTGFLGLGKKFACGLAICGWVSLVGGGLSIAIFLIMVVVIAFQSL